MNHMLPPEICFIQRGWFNSNTVVIKGCDGPVLIDSGHLLGRGELIERLRQHQIDPTKLTQIITTHAHSDHHGGNRILQELSGAPIGMGWITAEWFATGEKRLPWFDQVAQEVDVVPADIVYHEGDQIELAGLSFEVLHLPGHAPDSIGLYQPDHKVMICADALWENDVGMLNLPVHTDAIEKAEESLHKLSRYDIRVAIPGHGGLITGVEKHIANAQSRLQRFRVDPASLVRHYMRRMVMYLVLRCQPTTRAELLEQVTPGDHMQIYLEMFAPYISSTDAVFWLNELLDRFLTQGVLVQDEAGRLRSLVPL